MKQDVARVGTTADGRHALYRFRYVDEPTAGPFVGVLAQEVLATPDAAAVAVGAGGWLEVDYAALGLEWSDSHGVPL